MRPPKSSYLSDISSEKVISSSSSSSPSHVTLPQLFHVLCVIACGVSLMLWAYVLSTESYKGKAKSRMDVVLMVINLAGGVTNHFIYTSPSPSPSPSPPPTFSTNSYIQIKFLRNFIHYVCLTCYSNLSVRLIRH